MPRRSVNKTTTEKAAVVSEAMPQQVPQNIRKENPNASEKGQAATSRTTEPGLARSKRAVLLVITFVNSITSSILTGYSSFLV
jgi:hypothetical protein